MIAESVIKPLRPKPGWRGPFFVPAQVSLGYAAESWFHPTQYIFVISAVEVAKDKDGIDRGPEYHISISKRCGGDVQRCSAAEASWALDQFGLEGAEEDNHVPNGQVRNFWRTVSEPLIGLECACKATEPVILEGDYEWRP